MNFEKGYLYHVYNQGNNRQKIFFTRANYLFFIKKIETHILPYADVVAWCLMPNHFHLMLCPIHIHQMTQSHLMNMNMTQLSKSIAIMLRSYTRAIQKQENITGSLFRQKTKAKCLTGIDEITPSYFNTTFGTIINSSTPKIEYPRLCLDYIHNNPVEAGLVEYSENWEFSSIHEYNGIKKYGIINLKIAEDFSLIG